MVLLEKPSGVPLFFTPTYCLASVIIQDPYKEVKNANGNVVLYHNTDSIQISLEGKRSLRVDPESVEENSDWIVFGMIKELFKRQI